MDVAEMKSRLRQLERTRADLVRRLQELRDRAEERKAANAPTPLNLQAAFHQVQTAAENADIGIQALRDQIEQAKNPRPVPSFARWNHQ